MKLLTKGINIVIPNVGKDYKSFLKCTKKNNFGIVDARFLLSPEEKRTTIENTIEILKYLYPESNGKYIIDMYRPLWKGDSTDFELDMNEITKNYTLCIIIDEPKTINFDDHIKIDYLIKGLSERINMVADNIVVIHEDYCKFIKHRDYETNKKYFITEFV